MSKHLSFLVGFSFEADARGDPGVEADLSEGACSELSALSLSAWSGTDAGISCDVDGSFVDGLSKSASLPLTLVLVNSADMRCCFFPGSSLTNFLGGISHLFTFATLR